MSQIHIREKDTKNKTVTCIFHFAVPELNNAVGVPWNQVLQKALNPEPLMPDNDSTENANIVSGSIHEVQETVRFSSTNLTDNERIAEVEAAFQTRQTEIFDELAAKLDYFGKEINIS